MGHSSANASIHLVSLIILSGILSLETIKPGLCSDDHNVGCIDIERKALLKLKQGLMDPSGRLLSWVGEDCCKWSGVGCNNITGRVTTTKKEKHDGNSPSCILFSNGRGIHRHLFHNQTTTVNNRRC
ncbi:unnamed protein product [Prunus armeniaca]